MMKLIVILTLFLGYFENFSAYYVKMFHGKDLEIFGDMKKYRAGCDLKTKKSSCTDKYLIPKEVIQGQDYLGVGVILSASLFYCQGDRSRYQEYDSYKNPSKIFDIMNTFQVVSLKGLGCSDGLVVEAWSQEGAKRAGHQMGKLVAGTYEAVNRVKVVTEFITRDIFKFFGLLFIFLAFAFSYLRRNAFLSEDEDALVRVLPYWILYLFSISDIMQMILPVTKFSSLGNQLVSFLSISAHCYPVLFYVASRSRGRIKEIFSRTVWNPVSLILVIGVLSEYWITFFWFAFWGASLLYFAYGLKDKQYFFLAFSFFLVITILRIMNVEGMPSARTGSVFFCLYMISFSFSKFKYILFEAKRFSKFENAYEYKVKTEKAISEYEKQKALLEQARRVAHDIQSPLAVLEELRSRISDDQSGLFNSSIARLKAIAGNLLQFSTGNSELLSFKDYLLLIKVEKEVLFKCHINLSFEFEYDLYSRIEELTTVSRVVSNLITNSLEAYEGGLPNDPLTLSVGRKEADYIFVAIMNHSGPIQSSVLEKLNSGISFTTKAKGHGIGASSSYDKVTVVGGTILYSSEPSANFVQIRLPLSLFHLSKNGS